LGLVFAGHIVTDSKAVVTEAKTEVSRAHNIGADVSIVFQNQIVSTTVDGVAKGQRPAVDAGFSVSLEPAVHPFDIGNRRVLGGFCPIRTPNSVVGQVIVTQQRDAPPDWIYSIGWVTIFGIAAIFIITMIVVLILTSTLTKALRRINTDIIRIGLGDFEDPIEPPKRRDEAGDLGESVERLRVTVKQAIERLRRR
jgi:HAMP domain-containing protein